jgi:hypothetical protein
MRFVKVAKPKPKQPEARALCAAPVGIVVVKPQPKPPLPVVVAPVRTQERFAPLSAVTVPAIRKLVPLKDKPVSKQAHRTTTVIAKLKGPKHRVLNVSDVEEHKLIAELIVETLRKSDVSLSKVSIVSRFNGYFAMGAIVRGLRVCMKQGTVTKRGGRTLFDGTPMPSLYSIAPVAQAASGLTTQL